MIDRIMDYVVSYVFVAGDIIHSRGGRILLYWVWCHTVCSCLGSINIMCVQGVLLYVGQTCDAGETSVKQYMSSYT